MCYVHLEGQMFDTLRKVWRMTDIRKTRFYTINYKTYHRDRSCSYLKNSALQTMWGDSKEVHNYLLSQNSFMQYEPYPVGEPIKYQQKRITGVIDEIELHCCPRCGK